MVKYAKVGLLLAGMALLGVIVYQTDLAEVWHRLREVGGWGIAIILIVYFFSFLAYTVSWHLTLPSARLDMHWTYRLWKVGMVGYAFNNVTPLASLGGEPIKAALLKRHYGISYREATASLLLAQTINMIALVIFLLTGCLLMFGADILPPRYQRTAGLGLVAFSVCILLFFLVQRYKLFSRVGGWVGRGQLGARALSLLDLVHEVENRVIAFYTGHRRRFAVAVVLAFFNWALGAVEVYYAMEFLGHPISFAAAWVIEAIALLVRSALFFIPANIGTQEGTFLLVVGAISGSPALGLAVALIRRFREITWICWGLALGWFFSLGDEVAPQGQSSSHQGNFHVTT